MKKASKIDWDKVWKDFDKWCVRYLAKNWSIPLPVKQKKIQSLVEAQLRRKRK